MPTTDGASSTTPRPSRRPVSANRRRPATRRRAHGRWAPSHPFWRWRNRVPIGSHTPTAKIDVEGHRVDLDFPPGRRRVDVLHLRRGDPPRAVPRRSGASARHGRHRHRRDDRRAERARLGAARGDRGGRRPARPADADVPGRARARPRRVRPASHRVRPLRPHHVHDPAGARLHRRRRGLRLRPRRRDPLRVDVGVAHARRVSDRAQRGARWPPGGGHGRVGHGHHRHAGALRARRGGRRRDRGRLDGRDRRRADARRSGSSWPSPSCSCRA